MNRPGVLLDRDGTIIADTRLRRLGRPGRVPRRRHRGDRRPEPSRAARRRGDEPGRRRPRLLRHRGRPPGAQAHDRGAGAARRARRSVAVLPLPPRRHRRVVRAIQRGPQAGPGHGAGRRGGARPRPHVVLGRRRQRERHRARPGRRRAARCTSEPAAFPASDILSFPDLAAAVGTHPAPTTSAGSRGRAPSFPYHQYADGGRSAAPTRDELARALGSVDMLQVARAAAAALRRLRRGTPPCSRAATAAPPRSRTTCSATTSRASATAPTCGRRVFSLSTNIELFSAIANDLGYDTRVRVPAASRSRSPGTCCSRSRPPGGRRTSSGRWSGRTGTACRPSRSPGSPAAPPGSSPSVSVHVHVRQLRGRRGRPSGLHAPARPVRPAVEDDARRRRHARLLRDTMRVAINLLTDDPANPSGAHWFWTRVIPEMAAPAEPTTRSSTCSSARSRGRCTAATGRTGPVHHLPVVEREPATAHAERAPLRAGSPAAGRGSTCSAR